MAVKQPYSRRSLAEVINEKLQCLAIRKVTGTAMAYAKVRDRSRVTGSASNARARKVAKLRGCHVVKFRVFDVTSAAAVRLRATVVQ